MATFTNSPVATAVQRMAETGADAEAAELAEVLNAAGKREVYKALCALQREFLHIKYRLLRELEAAGYSIPKPAQSRAVIAGYCLLAMRDCKQQSVLDAIHCMLQVHEYAIKRGERSAEQTEL